MIPSDHVEPIAQEIRRQTTMKAYKLDYSDDVTTTLTSSKIGGLPYWPRDLAYPEAERKGLSSDEYLALLAQINLSDLGGDPRLPDHGLLQFFVTTDDLNGLEFDVPMDTQRHFRVIWHETIDPAITSEDVLARGIKAADNDDIFPVNGEHALTFSETEYWMTPFDVRFDEVFRQAVVALYGDQYDVKDKSWTELLADDDWDLMDKALQISNDMQSLIFGYPYFTQYDPRSEEDAVYHDTLLLQLDSDFGNPWKVMWGDSGVGAFFINGEALAKGDFARVFYNWDCY